MSDNFVIRVLERTGATVRLRAALAGNADFIGMPYPDGRAFFLMLAYLEEPALSDAPEPAWAAVRRSLAADQRAAGQPPTNQFALLHDAAWLEANLDRYVPQVTITHVRLLDCGLEDSQRFGQWLWNEAWGPATGKRDPDELYLEFAPWFEATVEFARVEFVEYLPPGRVFGTAAYAAFEEPPWSTPKLAFAPRFPADEFIPDSSGAPIPRPAQP